MSVMWNNRLLIVADNPIQAGWLKAFFEQSGYFTKTIRVPDEYNQYLSKGYNPSAVIIDSVYPDDEWGVAELVLKTRSYKDVPVIFISDRKDMKAKITAYKAGVTYYLDKPLDQGKLSATVAHAIGSTNSDPYCVLIVDEDTHRLTEHASLLSGAGMKVCVTSTPTEVPAILKNFPADCLVLDMNISQCPATKLTTILREDDDFEHMPVIYLSGEEDILKNLQEMRNGCEYLLPQPVDPLNFLDMVNTHARSYRRLKENTRNLENNVYELEGRQRALDAHAIVSITDANANITYINEKFCEISGYSREELLGRNHNIIRSGLNPIELYQDMWGRIASGEVWHGEISNRRKDGSLFWVDTTIIPCLNELGQPYQYISIRNDISHIKEAEERMRRSQLYANIGTWDWNIETGELFWSERVGPLFGYPEGKHEITHDQYLVSVHAEDRDRVRNAAFACINKGTEFNLEYRCVWRDGTIRWLLDHGDVVRDNEGRALHMLGVVQDITNRKQAEIELAKSRVRLEEAQALAKLGYWEADFLTGELHWTDEMYRIFGVDPASYTPTIEGFRQAIHPEDKELLIQSSLLAIKTGVYEVVHRIIRPDGGIRYVHALANAQISESGELLKLAGMSQDITELKLAEQAILQAKESAEAASHAKSEFLASMSHELRTPLNSILGFAQLLGMDTYLPEKTKEQALEIERAGQHLLKLVNDLIDLARIEAGKFDLTSSPVNIKSVINDSLAMVAPIAHDREITLVDESGDGRDYVVYADYTRLQQVLINLLANAIKYNRPDGVVYLTCEDGGKGVRISIRDYGYGISLEKQSRIFKAFDRLGEERGKIEGSGIGLVITKRIVDAMGGSIGFESREGEGSTFWVEFPLVSISETDLAQPVTDITEKPKCVAPEVKRVQVLYVEDNPTNQRLMQQIFSTRGNVKLRLTHSAQLGIQLASSEPPNIILMDINLPGMSGYEALAVLSKDPRTKDIPVVAISANAMKGEVERGLGAGFSAYITKPIDIAELLNTVDKLLANKDQKQ